MPTDVSLGDLITNVRARTDTTNSTFVTNTEIIGYINSALSITHDLLVAAFEDYFYKTASITPVAGYRLFPLEDDFYKLIGMYWVDTADADAEPYPLRRSTVKARNWPSQSSMQDNRGVTYRVIGHAVQFNPEPLVLGRFDYEYVPQFKRLRNLEDKVHWTVPVGWEDYAKYLVCADIAAKEEQDPSYWTMKADKIKGRIDAMAEERDLAEQHEVVDIYTYDDDTGSYWE